MSKFMSSFNIGKQGEDFAVKRLESLGIDYYLGDGKEVDLWIVIDGKKYKCEIKFDVYANKSGNIAIEFYNTRQCKPSGIDATVCDFWIHILGESVLYICKTDSLREFIKNNKPKRTLTSIGDGNSSIHLYDKSVIAELCFKDMTKETFNELVS